MTTSLTPPSLEPRVDRAASHQRAEVQRASRARPLFDPPIVKRAIRDAFAKLGPRHMVRNPVMFVVLLGSAYTTLVFVRDACVKLDPRHMVRNPVMFVVLLGSAYTTVALDPTRRRAWVSVRLLRSVSACAFPRPSAIASAKLAKSTVNHSHSAIWRMNASDSPWA